MAALTRAGGPDNIAKLAQYIAMFGEVEQKIVGCFQHGGGLPYTEFGRFHAIMAEESGGVFDAALVDGILPLAEGLPERLHGGIDVADIGCGSGHAVNVMAQAFPASRFTGFDFSDQALATGRAEAAALGLDNATFVAADVAGLRRGRGVRRRSRCSTRSTTRSTPPACWPTSTARCGRAVCC